MKKQLGLALSSLWLAVPLAMAQPAVPAEPAAQPTPSASQGLAEAKAAEAAAPSSTLDSALFYQLIVGEITVQEDEPAAGFALILDAARKTRDPLLFQRATEIALQSRSGDAALQAALAWKAQQPDSREANRYVLQILIALNRIADTLEPLKTEIALAPDIERPQIIASLPRGYARVKDVKLAGSVVEQALAQYLNQPANPAMATAAWTAVGRMRLAAEDTPGALQAAQNGQLADVAAVGPVLVALELMDPKVPEAEAVVQKYLQANPKAPPEIRLAYTQALLAAQRYTDTSAQLKIMTTEQPDFPEAWLLLGSLQLQDNQLAQSQASLERYVALAGKEGTATERSRRLSQAYLQLAQLAEKRKDFPAAEAWLAKIDNPQDLARVQTRRASVLAAQGKVEEARALIRQLPERNAEDARMKMSAEVSLLRDAKQYQAASDVLGQAIAKTPDDTDLLYEQAMMAEKLGKLDQMETLLRKTIALKPDFYNAYNALGYSLAERNVRLPEARELIKKALEFSPSDPFIQDSLGWVEFRLGNNAEAVRIFEAAYKAKPDAEIAAHYGEVLYSMGQRDRAVAIWKEGRMLNATNDTLVETLKRLRVRL